MCAVGRSVGWSFSFVSVDTLLDKSTVNLGPVVLHIDFTRRVMLLNMLLNTVKADVMQSVKSQQSYHQQLSSPL